MKQVNVQDAVGTVLAHDLTQIIPGEYKGPKFRKGHEITEDDLKKALDDIQKTTDKTIKEIDDVIAGKEKEIMEV